MKNPASISTAYGDRIARILTEMGWENAAWLEQWDGRDVEALREHLSEEEFQHLLDELEQEDVRS